MTALEKFVSCIIEEAEKAPPNTSIADLMGSMGWVDKQAELVLQMQAAVLIEREACARLCIETEPFYGAMFAEAIRARG